MKKLLLVALAVLFMVGVAKADGIPGPVNPKDGGAIVWTQTVYNGSGDDIQSAQVVRWDINASADDLSAWIEELDGVANVRTAGVTPYGKSCLNSTPCEIIVKGPSIVEVAAGDTVTTATVVEGTATGTVVDESLAGSDEAALGWAINSSPTTANSNLTAGYAVIYVNPSPGSED